MRGWNGSSARAVTQVPRKPRRASPLKDALIDLQPRRPVETLKKATPPGTHNMPADRHDTHDQHLSLCRAPPSILAECTHTAVVCTRRRKKALARPASDESLSLPLKAPCRLIKLRDGDMAWKNPSINLGYAASLSSPLSGWRAHTMPKSTRGYALNETPG